MRSHLRRWLLALPLLCATVLAWRAAADDAPVPAPTTAAERDDLLRRIMGGLARGRGVRARFRETKYLSLLTDPLASEGILYFDPPDRLARYTTSPGESSVVVRDGHAIFRDETGSQVIAIGSSGVARHLVDHLAVLLRGDLEALRSRHRVRIEGDDAGWTLELEPREPSVRAIVASIRVAGSGSELARMEVVEENGDRTVTVFSEVESGLAFDPAALDRFFPVTAPEDAR